MNRALPCCGKHSLFPLWMGLAGGGKARTLQMESLKCSGMSRAHVSKGGHCLGPHLIGCDMVPTLDMHKFQPRGVQSKQVTVSTPMSGLWWTWNLRKAHSSQVRRSPGRRWSCCSQHLPLHLPAPREGKQLGKDTLPHIHLCTILKAKNQPDSPESWREEGPQRSSSPNQICIP